MDLFKGNDKLYAIVQSNQCNADICLAESFDGVHFRMHTRPLITSKTCGKPTSGVVDGNFFLYYTAQDVDNRALNKMYLTTIKIIYVI